MQEEKKKREGKIIEGFVKLFPEFEESEGWR
jgi:hypothetical protein